MTATSTPPGGLPVTSGAQFDGPRTGQQSLLRALLARPGFLVCVGMLAAFSAAFKVLTVSKGIQFRLLPLPLRAPLDQLDAKLLYPFEVAYNPPPIKTEVLDTLGTTEY